MSSQSGRRWSIGFGEWCGVPVRIHWLLVLFVALLLGVTLDGSWSHGLMTVGIVLASVVLHEAAHCVSAIRLGGQVDCVVLWPVGGLQSPRVPDEPEPHLFVALIGPMANLCVVVASAITLLSISAPPPDLLPLLNPVGPFGMLDGPPGVVALKLALWINSTLFLLNLLPAYPFDGGPALRAILWPLLGRRTAAVATAHAAQVIALVLCVAALVLTKNDPQAVFPLWPPLVTLALFLFFSARRDLLLAEGYDATPSRPTPSEQPGEGYDLLEGDWVGDSDQMVLVEHTGDGVREQRKKKREADEAYEDARVDDILARLHARGFEQLSAEDRAVLQRASRRYRSRTQDDDAAE